MKTILIVCSAALLMTACRRNETAAALDLRALANATIAHVILEEKWIARESAAREKLSRAVTPGTAELARVDLDAVLSSIEAERKSHPSPQFDLLKATGGKPPYYPAVVGFESALGMAKDDAERQRLRAMDIDAVVKEFGVDAQ